MLEMDILMNVVGSKKIKNILKETLDKSEFLESKVSEGSKNLRKNLWQIAHLHPNFHQT